MFNSESLINTPTCFQSEKPHCIDLILTNKKNLFKNSKTFEVGISDHHHLVLTSLRLQYIQGNPKTKIYRDCKSFNFESFNNELNELLKEINYSLFENIFLHVLNANALMKKKSKKFNNNPFMTKQKTSLRKIVHLKHGIAIKKQRNFCVNLLRKTKKKEYFENIIVRDINYNKKL